MSKINISDAMYAKYSYSNGSVSYSDGGRAGYSTEVDIQINQTDENKNHGDGKIVGVDKTFSSGTIKYNLTDILPNIKSILLGVTSQTITGITGITDTGAKELIFDKNAEAQEVGFGIIIEGQEDSETETERDPYFRAVILAKVSFAEVSETTRQREETITWQGEELVGTIMRDDTSNEVWKREATFTTKAQALAYLKNRLNIT